MNAQTFELMLISPPDEYHRETQWVNQLFAEGLGVFHLRKPNWSVEKILGYLSQIEQQYYPKIMVHYREEVMQEVGIKGIHFQSTSLPLHNPDYTVSCGVHSWQEFQEVVERIDYAFVSPFFDSISKDGYKANHRLLNIPEGVGKRKAVALGGIDAGNICKVKDLGFKGAAVLGAVWNETVPVKAFLKLLERFNHT